jgi:hypothetical protein
MTMPEVPLTERIKWAAEDNKVALDELETALGGVADESSQANN